MLACLIEKEATVPDSYPLTLNSLRLACNQSTNRDPVVAYDDRTVEAALLSLKSMGLVRFVHPSHGGRTIRYRHVADERWHLSASELAVLAVLVLRGPQTVGEVRARHRASAGGRGGHRRRGDPRHPRRAEPRAVRAAPGTAARRARRAAGPTCSPVSSPPGWTRWPRRPSPKPTGDTEPGTGGAPAALNTDLARDVAELWLRVERLERKLGLAEDLNSPAS